MALLAATTPDPIHVLHDILMCSTQSMDGAEPALRSRLEVFALINVAGIVCGLPKSIVEDQVAGIKPLLLQVRLALRTRDVWY